MPHLLKYILSLHYIPRLQYDYEKEGGIIDPTPWVLWMYFLLIERLQTK